LSKLFGIWQDFVMFGRIHRTQSVILLWLAYRIGVVNSVARWCNRPMTQFFIKNGVISHAFVHGRRKDFYQGGTSLRLRFISENASLFALYVCDTLV